jgi:hypothetical protein
MGRCPPSTAHRCRPDPPPSSLASGWPCLGRDPPPFFLPLPVENKSAAQAPFSRYPSPLPFSFGQRAQHPPPPPPRLPTHCQRLENRRSRQNLPHRHCRPPHSVSHPLRLSWAPIFTRILPLFLRPQDNSFPVADHRSFATASETTRAGAPVRCVGWAC